MEQPVLPLHLKPADLVLQQQGQEAVVLVRADPLVAAVARAPRVPHQLQMRMGALPEDRVVEVGGRPDGGEQLAQQPLGDGAEPVDPRERGVPQLRQGGGPLVGPLQPPVRGLTGPGYPRGPLGPDVELVPPVPARRPCARRRSACTRGSAAS